MAPRPCASTSLSGCPYVDSVVSCCTDLGRVTTDAVTQSSHHASGQSRARRRSACGLECNVQAHTRYHTRQPNPTRAPLHLASPLSSNQSLTLRTHSLTPQGPAVPSFHSCEMPYSAMKPGSIDRSFHVWPIFMPTVSHMLVRSSGRPSRPQMKSASSKPIASNALSYARRRV